MLFTASTVKDSLENVRFFVSANLASGVDHMFVFLDAPGESDQQDVAAWLGEHPHVTCIPTARRAWWSDGRPANLNVRQRTNANWARAVLEPFSWAEWLFHIDGDEVACLDREAIASIPEDLDAVRLTTWEAVSEWASEGRPTRFKRLLDDGELNLLHLLGAIPEPANQVYFHGHVMGKSGVRPRSGLGLTLHEAVSQDGRRQPRHEDARLHVLHYDAPSGEEFVRKWTALAQAGPARYRQSRSGSTRAIRTLLARDLPDEIRVKYLRRLYEVTTRDDVELLHELGLLVEARPDTDRSTARPLPEAAADELADRVAELGAAPKAGFFVPDPPAQPARGRWSGLRRRVHGR
ncbi:MAG: glycosyltransferase family 2 protein [Nocardioides sp.]|nr:glycosyltransferase family 2 protein [Nocardioides sp.]